MRKYLQNLFNVTSDIVLIFNSDGAMIRMNRAGERCTGYRFDDLSCPSFPPFFKDAHRAEMTGAIRRVLSGDEPAVLDLPIVCADQLVRNIRWHILAADDDYDPCQKQVVFCGSEIEKAGAQDVPSSYENYRLLFENAGIGMMYFNEHSTITRVNKEFENLLGYTRADVEGKMKWTDLVAGEDDLRKMKEYHRLRGIDPVSVPASYNTKLRHRNGDVLDIVVRVTMIPQTTDRMVSFLDMTQERRAQEAIRDSEIRYRSLVDNIQDCLYRCDLQGNVVFCNPSAARLIGYERPEDIIGRNAAADFFYSPAQKKEFIKQMKRHGQVTHYEVMLKHKSGSALTISASSRYSFDQEGNVLGIEGLFTDITERKQAEDKFSNIFMMAPDGISIVRLRDAFVMDANIGFETISGWRRNEAIGRTVQELNFWTDPADQDFLVGEFREGRDIRQKEFQFRCKDQTVRDGVYSAKPLQIAGEDCVIFVLQDITLRKATEKILKENEERLQAITGNMPGVVYQFYAKDDGEHGISYANFRMSNIFGLPIEYVDSFSLFSSRIHPEDQDKFMGSIHKAVETRSSWNFEGRFIKPSGDVMWFHGMSTPTRIADGVIFNGVLLDITEQKNAEETSRQTEEKFYKVFATTPDCIVITRLHDEKIMEVNRGFEEIIGWKREEVLGRLAVDIDIWHDLAERRWMIEELKAGRDVLNREAMFRRKDGSLIHVIYSARTINIAGELSLIFVLHDISEQRRLEEERQKLEEQLFQSQKMDAIGQLASGVAHDFNNILTGIQGNASLMMMDFDTGHMHYQKLSRIEENVKRGANLTKQLLGFARGGKYEIKTMDVNELIRKNAQLFTETKKEIEADFQLQTDVYPIEADAGQLDQVFLNIFINAGHAMPGGGNLFVQTANVELPEKEASAFEIPPGSYVRISISDTGTGMDQTTLKRIFEPFFTTKSKQGGTGLGLASVYGIIRNHGGAITVQSEPGRGTMFIIYLPASQKQIAGEEQNAFSNLVSGSGVILLVDDEPMILDTASEMLKMLGYTVYAAPTGQEAVSIYMEMQKTIDLVILDMILPGMNGSQILKLLKDINPDVRVILSSGYSMQGDARDVMDMGCTGFIQKPYTFSDLSTLVNKAMQAPRKNTQ